MRGWLARAGKDELERMPKEERGASKLIHQVGMLLHDQSDLEGAESLYREVLQALGGEQLPRASRSMQRKVGSASVA